MRHRKRLGLTGLAGVLVVVPLLLWIGSAAADTHGIGFQKGCNSPTKIGDPVVCHYTITNNNFTNASLDTVTINSLADITHAAAGDTPNTNILGNLEIYKTFGNATCVASGGTGTFADPWTGVTSCSLPGGNVISGPRLGLWSELTTKDHNGYVTKPADFNINPVTHSLANDAKLGWVDQCDVDPQSCNTNQQTATAPSATTLIKRDSLTATDIHNAAHQIVTTVGVGTTVHDFITVTTNDPDPGNPIPNGGNVLVEWFLNGTCTGAAAATATVGPVDATGHFDATGFSFTVNSAGHRAFRAHYLGDGTYNGSDGACEPLTVVDANIQLNPPTATNRVGSPHTLTCHINVNDGNGFTNAPAGTTCTVAIINGPGTPATQNCLTVGVTGDCQVVITSNTTGLSTIRASTDVTVGGVALHRETGDAHVGDGPNAQKLWVNAAIVIAPNATNEIGQSHTFTATLLFDTGAGLQPAGAGQSVTITLIPSNGACPLPTGPFNGTTNASGQVSATFTSQCPGQVAGHASWTGSVSGSAPFTVQTDGVAPNSSDAVKTFVDANIQITPATANNPVGTNHTLHCHININAGLGAGYVNAPAGTVCTVNITAGPGTPPTQNCTTVGATGTCDVVITSSTTGTSTIQATTTLSIGGVTLTRTTGDAHVGDGPNALKNWADDTIVTHVRDAANNDITGQTVAGGTVVHDEATVAKAAGTPAAVPNPTGTVTFTLFTGLSCNGAVLATDPNKPLVAGTATSATFTTPAANGDFSYLAHYNGDANYPAHNAACEPFSTVVQAGKNLNFSGSMEGALKWMPGAFVNGGYHFWLSQKNPVPVTVQVTGTIDVPVHCGGPHGPLVGVISVPVSIPPFTIPANSTAKYLTADQNNILSWMGAVASPDLCAGGLMYNSEGATFNVIVNSSAHTGVINFQWHYRIPAAKNKPNTDCTNANDPNRDRADVCGASWSATKEP